jgi:predicted transglutaminase-like cysteine proteinase
MRARWALGGICIALTWSGAVAIHLSTDSESAVTQHPASTHADGIRKRHIVFVSDAIQRRDPLTSAQLLPRSLSATLDAVRTFGDEASPVIREATSIALESLQNIDAFAPVLAEAAPRPVTTDNIAGAMPAGQPVRDAPAGFISFCSRFLEQCVKTANEAVTIHLDGRTTTLLATVNRDVNRSIVPMADWAHYGIAEYWDMPDDGYGNCKDYALTKRARLIEAGLAERALRIAIVLTPRDERHAVLTVATDKGDLVLDNLNDEVRLWTQVRYRWLERQDDSGELGWVAFSDASVSAPGPLTTSATAAKSATGFDTALGAQAQK